MPRPMPKMDEGHDEFMIRCMDSQVMMDECPDKKEREEACEIQWNKKSSSAKKEIRSFQFRMVKEGEESRKMVGHAAVFNQETDIGWWFREMILPGAFKKSIKEDDVRALFNHNPDFILGRNVAGTLKLSEDDTGLKVDIDPPDTQFARDLGVSITRGDISQMSFAFEVLEEEWIMADKKEKNAKMDLRKIKRARLYDVSPVTFPAYEGTDIAMRSHDAWIKEQEQIDKPEPQGCEHGFPCPTHL